MIINIQEIRTEILIKASVTDVWNKLIDFSNYPHWNPFIPSILGKPVVGETLQVKICPPQKKPMAFQPKLLVMKENQELRWAGHFFADFFFRGEHYFQLEKVDEMTTRFIHGEIFSGLLTPLILQMLRTETEQGFKLMNEALAQQLKK